MSLLDDNFDIVERNLIILGVTPTQFVSSEGKSYDRVNCICIEKLKGDNSLGFATTNYHYGTSESFVDFVGLDFPITVKAHTTTVTNVKGDIGTSIDKIFFDSVKEVSFELKKQVKKV